MTAVLLIRMFVLWMPFTIVCRVSAGSDADDSQRPNIIYILADDLGWSDTGVYGSQYYETPNIDRLASEGIRFTQYHNCPNCQPTRAALMTGQYPPRTGVYTVGGIDRFNWKSRPLRPVDNAESLRLDRITIAEQLKSAGYVTGIFGKWHLGQKGKHHPSQRGFDEAIVTMGQHYNFKTDPAVEYPKGTYLADFLTDRAIDFIHRKRSQPFFLYLAHFGVHSPIVAKPELHDRFRTKAPIAGHKNPTYAGMIYSIDESVGRIMKALDELELTDNTVVIFSSDNGGVGGYVREGLKQSGDVTDNAPLRSGKGSLYEGGVRDPLIVRWPGIAEAGRVCDVPTIHVDLFPTLCEIASAELPQQVLDGESLVPLLRSGDGTLRRTAIFQHFPGYLGAGQGTWRTTPVGTIQKGDWKLLEFFEDGRLELYNLRQDVGETHNLATSHPEKLKELLDEMTAWRKLVQAPMPTPNAVN